MNVPDHIREIARRLAAAYISYQMGISIGHTLKVHIGEDVGEYWITLAEQVCRQQADALKERQSDLAELLNPTHRGPIQ